jgi:DNA polymerase
MSQDIATELIEVLRSAREQAKFLRELGVENLSLELITEPELIASSGMNRALPDVTPSGPALDFAAPRVISTPKTAQPAPSMFGDPATSGPLSAESSETLEQIWRDIGDCTRCGLCEGRTQIVNTHGNRKARLMFVGEAPGADEDAQGKPFVGRAGQLLTKMIEAMGIKREDVIIGNVNRCRPPGNRQPTLEEAAICRPFLFREISAIQPEIIVVMGNTALRNLLEVREGITRVRGKFQDFRGIKVMPTFHPAYLLRDPSKKRETWEDLKMVRDYLETNPPKSNS